ncbi:MAG: threonine/serine exporter family protein [Clostridiales Family XIII bacterium]|jgi:uncharacterized membrane protein YjjP (DUF1212 family)|nr:threonine/serine exporter family protein [Clostridiales Family XIII bacterium]
MMEKRQKRILVLALFAGEIMMRSGAEIYRVEDTIVRICRACDIPYVECFATTTGIFLSLDGGQDGDMHTFIKRIHSINTDLDKISRINRFSRAFTSTDLSVEEGFQQLRAIDRIGPYSLPANLAGAIFIGFSLCMSFGGGILDSVFCALISAAAYLASMFVEKLRINAFVSTFLSCAACTLLSVLTLESGLGSALSPIIIASITMFLPGVAITNAARDMLSGDMLSGVARLSEALIRAIAIACGVGAVLKVWSLAGGGLPYEDMIVYPMYMFFIFGFLTTFGFCIQFHVPGRQMAPASLVGALGFCLYEYVLIDRGGSVIFAALVASGLVAALAEFFSRAGKDATTLFIIPGIIPLVPGTGMYITMTYVMQSDFANVAESGTRTFITAGGIAVALVIVASISRLLMATAARIGDAAASAKKKGSG